MLVSRRGDPRFEWGREKRGEGKVMIQIELRREDQTEEPVVTTGVISISPSTTLADIERQIEILRNGNHFGIPSPWELWPLPKELDYRRSNWGLWLHGNGIDIFFESDNDTGLLYKLLLERRSDDYLFFVEEFEVYRPDLTAGANRDDEGEHPDIGHEAELSGHEGTDEDGEEDGEDKYDEMEEQE